MKVFVATAAVIGLLSAAPAFADADLAKKKNCMACHQVDKKVVGPSYKEVSEKYKGQADAPAMLAEKVIKGGKGVWGPVAMPPNPTVTAEEANALVSWILAM